MAHLMHLTMLFLLVLDPTKDKPCRFSNIVKYTCHTICNKFGNGVFERL